MKEIINKITSSIIYSSVAAIIAALILIFAPALSISTLGVAAGILLLGWGLLMIFLDSRITFPIFPFEGMLLGVISIILGLALLSNPTYLSILLLFAVGIWIIASSINNLKMAFTLRRVNDKKWIKIALIAVIDLIIGTLVVLNPFSAAVDVTIFIGIMLLIHSFLSLVDALMLRKDINNLEDAYHGLIREAEIIRDTPNKDKKTKSEKADKKKDGKSSKKSSSSTKTD